LTSRDGLMCLKEAGEIALGWQAYLVGDPDTEDDEEVLVYCPDCARREFGPFDAGSGGLEAG
jgi:hypothetical protein